MSETVKGLLAGFTLCLVVLVVPSRAHGQLIEPDFPITVFADHQNEPDVAMVGNYAVAVWFGETGNFYSPVGFAYSTNHGQSWTNGGWLPVPGNSPGIKGQPTIVADASGNFYACSIGGGDHVIVHRGAFIGGGFGWNNGVIASPEEVFVPYDHAWIACDRALGNLYVTYTRAFNDIEFIRSQDGGATWSTPMQLSSGKANGSCTSVGPDGDVYVLWEDYTSQQIVGRRSNNFGETFGPQFIVSSLHDNTGSGPPGYSEVLGRAAGNDFPMMDIDRSSGPYQGTVYVTWSEFGTGSALPGIGSTSESESNDTYETATEVNIGHDISGVAVTGDIKPGGDRDVFSFVAEAGTTISLSGIIDFVSPASVPCCPLRTSVTLYCDSGTRPALGRMTIAEAQAGTFPPIVFTIPENGRYYFSLNSVGGANYGYSLSLREYRFDPESTTRDHRDVVLAYTRDGGATWSKTLVNNDPPHFDNFLPRAVVDGTGGVHVIWSDRRDDILCGAMVHTYWSRSDNGGETFDAARRLSSAQSSWDFFNNMGSNIGDHLALTASESTVLALWTDTRNGNADIFGTRILPDATAIAVGGLRAVAEGRSVHLSWTVMNGADLTGYRIHRAEAEQATYMALMPSFQPLQGAGSYQATDSTVELGRQYFYQLEVEGLNGSRTWEGPVGIFVPQPVTRLQLGIPSPNPFRENLTIELALPQEGRATLAVYDVAGRRIATLLDGAMPSGIQRLRWDGHRDDGSRVQAGLYLIRADAAGQVATSRVIRMN